MYDRNTNITQLTRFGKYYSGLNYNDVSYELLDDLEITYNGNQRVLVEDFGMEPENFYGDFSFGAGGDAAYEYDANGSLVEDGYKGLTYSYDLLGHPLSVVGQDKTIGYVYAADGRKLRTTHRTKRMNQWIETKTDYRGRFIYENGDATMCRFDGGYIGFKDDEMNGCYYYIKDYQGNNRMVVKGSQTIDQVNHYYPDGSLMGEISIEGHAQKFRFGGKELDKTYGLNLYDFHARQYDPQVPAFTSIDPLAEDEPSISPYAYCAGDPVNFIDPTGTNYYAVTDSGKVVLARVTDDDFDCLVASNGEVHRVNDQSILSDLSTNKHLNTDNSTTIWTNSSSTEEMLNLFFFMQDHTSIEWAITKYSDGTSTLGAYNNRVSKGHEAGGSPADLYKMDGHSLYDEKINMHSHIDNSLPSGSYDSNGIYDKVSSRFGDQYIYECRLNQVGLTKIGSFYISYKKRIKLYDNLKVHVTTDRRHFRNEFKKR